jgi:hypothetical protein
MIITQPECVSVALGIQHVLRMRRIILSSVTRLAVQYFPQYLINGKISRKIFEHKMRILIFYAIFF